jgi:rhamnosyltransferase subunit B
MARIVFATVGSLGDLHPVIAFALGLRARGHHVAVASAESYREKIRALGLEFHALRPDLLSQGEYIIAEIMDGSRGSERLMRERIFPAVRDMYADLQAVVRAGDILIASELVTAASILAATHGVRWVSYELAPVSLFSRHDPPVLPAPDSVRWLQRGGYLHRVVKHVGKIVSHGWWRPVREFRRELGLPPGGHPLFEGKYSPELNLAMFSAELQRPQPDWPAGTVQTGFLFHDEPERARELPQEVRDFLAADEPPIVVTLGSAAVYIAGDFYARSAAAVQRLGRRAVLLVGKNAAPASLPPSILAWDYLPFAQIFPHAAAIVHQGGVGTTAQALRAGRPMLVVPFAHDQFDNAARMVRLGVARTLARRKFTAGRVAAALDALLADRPAAARGAEIAARIATENGVARACTAVEMLLD